MDLQQQIHLFRNANDTVELWCGRIWMYPQPKRILQPHCSATQHNDRLGCPGCTGWKSFHSCVWKGGIEN